MLRSVGLCCSQGGFQTWLRGDTSMPRAEPATLTQGRPVQAREAAEPRETPDLLRVLLPLKDQLFTPFSSFFPFLSFFFFISYEGDVRGHTQTPASHLHT